MLDAGKPGSRPRMIVALLGVVKNNASSLSAGRCHRIENGADVGGEGGKPAASKRAQIIHGVEQASRVEAGNCRVAPNTAASNAVAATSVSATRTMVSAASTAY